MSLLGAATLDDVDDFFSIKPVIETPNHHDSASNQPSDGYALPSILRCKDDAIRGRMIDEDGNPITPDTYTMKSTRTQPSYQLESSRYPHGRAYVQSFKDQHKSENSLTDGMGNMRMDDTATIERLETRSMTGSTISTNFGQMFNLPNQEAKVTYAGYRMGCYDTKLPITLHREKIINTIESTQCTIIQGMTGCGKTTQVPQYILDEYAKTGRRCKIAVTQPRRIAAISIAKRVCSERKWTEGTYCGYQVARDTKFDVEKTMITYMTTGILLQKLINEKSLNAYTHIILDEVHERDQDTDLALLIVKKFIHTVSPQVKVILMSATFDCQVFANYFATEIRGDMQKAPVINVEGRGFKVHQIHWSDSYLNNMVVMPRFNDQEPTVFPEAMLLTVRLMYEFDRLELEEQKKEIAEGKPVSRGTVLIFLPGLAEIQDLSSLLEKEAGLKDKRLTILPLHASITLEEQGRVFEPPHILYRKVILSTNIAESSITVADIKYVIDFCLTKNLQTDPETNMTCLRMEWASKANCKQRMGRAGRVSNGRVYRLVHKAFYQELMEYGVPEMNRCPLTQLILRVKKLGSEEPRYILSTAIDPPDMNEIGKSILLLKEAGALADPKDPRKYNPFDGEMTFVGVVLASLPLNIELGKWPARKIGKSMESKARASLGSVLRKMLFSSDSAESRQEHEVLFLPHCLELLLVFGHMLGLLPECLIIAAAMHTRSIFQQPFKRRVEAFMHRLKWDRGLHSDPISTVNAYKEWDRLREQEYFMRAPNAEAKWCRESFLQKKTLNEVREVIHDLTMRLEEHGIRPRASVRAPHLRKDRDTDPAHEQLLLKVALSCAFYPHYFGYHSLPESEAVRTLSGKSPLNTVYMKGFPNNQGILYKRQVEQMISEHIPGCKVHASFENTKCYIEFNHASGDCSSIPNAMYVALRIAQLRERLEIHLYDDRDSFKLMQMIGERQKDLALNQGRLDTNRIFLNKDKLAGEVPRFQTLPSSMMTCIELLVVHVEECGHFWGHEVNERKLSQLQTLQEGINNTANVYKASSMFNPAVGALCIAPFLGSYYRARIISVRGGVVEVFFADYGNTEEVDLRDVRELLPEFRGLEFQAIECMVAGIGPPVIGQGRGEGVYPPTINQMFSNMISERQLLCQIYSVVKGVLRLNLISDTENRHVDIRDVMYSKGMIIAGEESFVSMQNHRLRYPEEAMQGRSDPVPEVEEGEWGFGLEEDVPRLAPTQRRQVVAGPYSPTEMKFHCLSVTGMMKEVRIEPSSVNAIALDEEPSDKQNRLMIAATMSVNQMGNKIIARETTLMPNIHGLPALMCLLFAPSIQIRRDAQRKTYTGAICGLGRDPRTGGSAFPDHDMEIEFDTDIDVDDIIKINGIRMSFNYCLGGSRVDVDETAMTRFQMHIRQNIKDLLKKSRQRRDKVYCRERLQWSYLDPDDLLKHELEDTAADQVHLFRLISSPILENNDSLSARQQDHQDWILYLKNQCKKLTRIASGSVNKPLNIVCELCSVQVSNNEELHIHLQSKVHRGREINLFSHGTTS